MNNTKTLFRHSQALGPIDVADILDDISLNQQVDTLMLNNNRLGDEGLKLLVDGLVDQPQIKQLLVSDNQLTDESCRYIAQLKQLTHLDISNNAITDRGVGML